MPFSVIWVALFCMVSISNRKRVGQRTRVSREGGAVQKSSLHFGAASIPENKRYFNAKARLSAIYME